MLSLVYSANLISTKCVLFQFLLLLAFHFKSKRLSCERHKRWTGREEGGGGGGGERG